MVDVNLLKKKIDESGMTMVAVCEKTGILRQTMYKRLDDPAFTVDEANALRKVLRLSSSEVRKIFFATDVK